MAGLATITNKIPYGAHVIILFVLTFAAFILTILVTFSTPFIKSIYFLSIGTGDGETTFGAFGWCNDAFCLDSTVGYEYAPQVNNAMTSAMILWAIGIIFLFFLLLAILPLLFIHESRALRTVGNRMFFMFSAYLSNLFIPLAWVLSIYGWSIARRTFEVGGVGASFGPAMWMGLTAALCVIIVTILGWPHEAWDGKTTRANGGVGARGLPGPGATGNGYYHYKRTTREVVPQGQQFRY